MDDVLHRNVPWATRRAQRWFEQRTFGAGDVPAAVDLVTAKRATGARVSVVLPALNEAETIGAICSTIRGELMGRHGLVDELLVIDGESIDGTDVVAGAAGARVVRSADLIPQIPAVRGKGESLWRSLTATTGDIVVWIDADIRNFGSHFVSRLVAPLLLDRETSFVKAFYRRPIAEAGELQPSGGGRVTELLARPMLNALFPELSAVIQPLSGEYAGRREVLERLPFFTGYSVEVGLLIDLVEMVGLDALAQVDLDERVHRNRPIEELTPMAYAIGRTIMQRAEEWGRMRASFDYRTQPLVTPDGTTLNTRDVLELERPPLTVLLPTLRSLRDRHATVAAIS